MKWLASVLILACGVACSQPQQDEVASPPEGPNASIIRHPLADTSRFDPESGAVLTVENATHDFGAVPAGVVVEHAYTITNTGRGPLLITDARSSCGCTVADYPQTPLAPAERARVTVRFDTANRSGRQSKTVKLYANTLPSESLLYLTGTIVE